MEQHTSSVAICGKISLLVRKIVSIPVHDVLKLDNYVLCSCLCPTFLYVLGCCLSPEFMSLCQVVASILRCYLCPGFYLCPEFMALCQVVACILRCYPCPGFCVQNLWHCARLLSVSCVVTHVLDFCVCPEFMALCQVVASILRCYPSSGFFACVVDYLSCVVHGLSR